MFIVTEYASLNDFVLPIFRQEVNQGINKPSV